MGSNSLSPGCLRSRQLFGPVRPEVFRPLVPFSSRVCIPPRKTAWASTPAVSRRFVDSRPGHNAFTEHFLFQRNCVSQVLIDIQFKKFEVLEAWRACKGRVTVFRCRLISAFE